MKNLIYILNMLMILIFASCKDENAFMLADDDQPCYTIFVKKPNPSSTRATYDDKGSSIAVKWEKGDVVTLTTGGQEYSFLFRNTEGDIGEFYHYGKIPSDNALPANSVLSFGNVAEGDKTFDQLQRKNNACREYLVADVKGLNLTTTPTPTVDLYPASGYSLLHLQVMSPGMLIGGSLLKIKGLDASNEYNITLGDNSGNVFADKGDNLDIYVVVPANKTISGTLKFYLYAYDENKKNAIDGDEYHYYMKCNASIKTANREVVKLPLPNKPTHTAIQMGLPSGTKWATMNVGATKESEIGDYFAWGEVETKSSYTDGNSVTVDKTYSYLKGSVLNRFQLAVEYDAATENWGNDWVMPTNAEAKELVKGCTWTSATKDGVSGYSVSRGNKSIFLPATGYMGNTGIANASYAYYWLSSLVNDNYTYLNKVASSLYFEGSGKGVSSGGLRSHGRAIRPILASSRATQEYKWEFEDIEGTLSGVFSVDDNKKVKFSKGNLQYQASTNTWRFAENQYDIVGLEGNAKISENYAGWIDLFGWGTSGQATGANTPQPYSISMNNNDYYVGGVSNKALSDNADWGYNAISNGGNQTGKWRTMSDAEWDYLICKTDNSNRKSSEGKLNTKATVNKTTGALLFPDGWITPSDIKIKMAHAKDFTTNTFTQEEFEYLEFLGVVFLPTAGYRAGTVTKQLGEWSASKNAYEIITGTYWTSSFSTSSSQKDETGMYAKNICIKSNLTSDVFGNGSGNWIRGSGQSVRLIHNVITE